MTIEMQDRDYEIIQFLKEFKVADSKIIADLFFSGCKNSILVANRRLKKLVDNKKINRNVDRKILEGYLYYPKGISKPSNWKHSLEITRLYVNLVKKYQVVKYKREYEIRYSNGKLLRADLMAVLKINGKLIPYLFEIDLKAPYNKKYDEYIINGYWKNKFPCPPTIVSISRFKHVKSNCNVKLIPVDYEELVL